MAVEKIDPGLGRVEIAGFGKLLRPLPDVMAVDDRPIRNEAGLVIDKKPQPQRIVLCVVVSLVEKTDLVPSRTIDADRNAADVVAKEQGRDLQPGLGHRPPQIVLLPAPAGLEQQPKIGIEEIDAGIAFNPAAVDRELVRLEQIVRAQPMHPIAPRRAQPGIQRRGDAAIGLVHRLDPRIAGGIGVDDRAGPIGRAVIDDDGFPVRVGLG